MLLQGQLLTFHQVKALLDSHWGQKPRVAAPGRFSCRLLLLEEISFIHLRT